MVISFLLILAGLFSGCKNKQESTATPPQTIDNGISAYTSGVISRESVIQVRFSVAAFRDSAKVNVPLGASPFTFKPAIKGTAVWTSDRSLEFRPAERLTAGQQYKGVLKLAGLALPVTEKFAFSFTAMKQSFDIQEQGLRTTSDTNLTIQQFLGSVTTADAEVNQDVEKLVSATQRGKSLPLTWTHQQDRRIHQFTIDSIARGNDSSTVTLSWKGSALGVDKTGSTTITIPPLQEFSVTSARAVQEAETYLELRFSDPLDKSQNLTGLIRTGKNNVRFSIDNNAVRVYSSTAWTGTYSVTIEKGVRNSIQQKLQTKGEFTVSFATLKPQVAFVGKGAIVPTTHGQTIPIEAINLKAVIVEATRIFETTMPQFLQINDLEGSDELKRVGRVIWKKVINIDPKGDLTNQRIRYGLDVSELIADNPGGLYRINLSFRRHHINYRCDDTVPLPENETFDLDKENSIENDNSKEASGWDGIQEYYDEDGEYDGGESGSGESDPCKAAYYRNLSSSDISVSRNVLISDIGIIAKRGENDSITIVTTDIRSAQPLPNATLSVYNYQEQRIGSGKTDQNGMATIYTPHKPFLLIAGNGTQKGYLRLDDGVSLPISHFDVSGDAVKKGIKGFLYGERGVWRPGDTLFLTFIVNDPTNRLPKDHPVQLTLYDARNHEVATIKRNYSVNGFYQFTIPTDYSAPTGNWTAEVTAGGAVFKEMLSVETVMPNRLKILIDFGKAQLINGEELSADLSSRWLHGAPAKSLNADVKMTLASVKTAFPRFGDYIFDDPTRTFNSEETPIFEGTLDETGKTGITITAEAQNVSPGALVAQFTTRVFEPGGAFSIDRFTLPFHPYNRYIGIKTPKGDKSRGMLLTDTTHAIHIAAVNPDGTPASDTKVVARLYQINWRWWWEKGAESCADFASSESHSAIITDTVAVKNGQGVWNFKINYPSWGRYLISVADLSGNHATGKVVYIDWPGWAGRAQKNQGAGANVLSFSSDKNEYTVGEKATIVIPAAKKGRGLVSIENGTRVLRQEWLEGGSESINYQFDVTENMVPNVYVSITYLQPHLSSENDVPLRTYGIIPVKVINPATRLSPKLDMPDILIPDQNATITVSEASGKPMTYTVAIVDEGLLDLTRYKTPDPWSQFFKREALGVKTWDMFDMVAGAYGATLERLLSIGGDEDGGDKGKKRANRFPPMVRFMGPFNLEKNGSAKHSISIPQYIGSVRAMVVAGNADAFGNTDKTVPVRKPLMLLGTLPRVLTIQEQVDLPVSVFALEPAVKNVTVSISIEGPLAIVGSNKKEVSFASIGDELVTFRAKAKNRSGIAVVTIRATGAGESTEQKIEIDIRNPSEPVTEVVTSSIAANKSWKASIPYSGIAGTNSVMCEVTAMPPIDLGRRLTYLIQYPHGCIEQTTSSVFPQLYLDKLIDLSPDYKKRIEKNIKAGIDRLRTFQTADGGFAYWPGNSESCEWGTTYGGNFLAEAQKAGYNVPAGMMQQWVYYQQKKAREWVTGGSEGALTQAYRLYTLALSGNADIGAMNRLREQQQLTGAEKWRLAASYQLAGQSQAARDIAKSLSTSVAKYRELAQTYGSDVRDKAMILEALTLIEASDGKAAKLLKEISAELSANTEWMSTQSTAYALVALARYSGVASINDAIKVSLVWNDQKVQSFTSNKPVFQIPLTAGEATSGTIELTNTGSKILYSRVIISGIPAIGSEKASAEGLTMSVTYELLDGDPVAELDVIEQGQDIVATVEITNTGKIDYEEIALTHLVPSGFEIHNHRLSPSKYAVSQSDYQDIRDDRIYSYFDIRQQETKRFRILCNASYRGKFYLPLIAAEAMYDATINARVPGRWIEIVEPGKE